MGSAVLTSSNPSWPWPATADGKLTAEALGASGAGGYATNTGAATGGGKGGSYGKVVLTKGVETTLAIVVGAAGTSNPQAHGGASTVTQNSVLRLSAAGGQTPAANATSGATAINGSNTEGDSHNEGGNGGNSSAGVSGGGGGAAGPTSVGSAGSGITHGAKGSGTFVDGSSYQGDGADGVNSDGVGQPGNTYGGAGSGAYASGSPNRVGGAGTGGLVVLTWIDVCAPSIQERSSFTSTSRASLEPTRHLAGVSYTVSPPAAPAYDPSVNASGDILTIPSHRDPNRRPYHPGLLPARGNQFGVPIYPPTYNSQLSNSFRTPPRMFVIPNGELTASPPFPNLPVVTFDPSTQAVGSELVTSFRPSSRPITSVVYHPHRTMFAVTGIGGAVPVQVSFRTPTRQYPFSINQPQISYLFATLPVVTFDPRLWPSILGITQQYYPTLRTPDKSTQLLTVLENGWVYSSIPFYTFLPGVWAQTSNSSRTPGLVNDRKTHQPHHDHGNHKPPLPPVTFDPSLWPAIVENYYRPSLRNQDRRDTTHNPGLLPIFDRFLWPAVAPTSFRTLPRQQDRRDTTHMPGLLPIFDVFLFPATQIYSERTQPHKDYPRIPPNPDAWIFNSVPIPGVLDPKLWPAIDIRNYLPPVRKQERRDTTHVAGLPPIFDRFTWVALNSQSLSFRSDERKGLDIRYRTLPADPNYNYILQLISQWWPANNELSSSYRAYSRNMDHRDTTLVDAWYAFVTPVPAFDPRLWPATIELYQRTPPRWREIRDMYPMLGLTPIPPTPLFPLPPTPVEPFGGLCNIRAFLFERRGA